MCSTLTSHLSLRLICHSQVNVLEPEVRKVGVACPLSLPRGHTVLNDSHNLEWHITLEPETDVGLKLVYSVEFPQQDAVKGLP